MEHPIFIAGTTNSHVSFYHGIVPIFTGLNRLPKDQVDAVTIPWWDWSSNISGREGIPRIFADENVDGEPNPLYKAHIDVPTTNPPLDMDTFRTPRRPSELPIRDEVDRVFALSDFGDFNDGLEDIHDQIHGWTGGTMGRVATAAF